MDLGLKSLAAVIAARAIYSVVEMSAVQLTRELTNKSVVQ